jgi:signal transduction histidine kinase
LFFKQMIPFLVLMLLLGTVGGFVIVRDLSSRAETSLGQDLSQRSLDVRSFLRDRELSLIESTNVAANVQGMAEATRAGDRVRVAELLRTPLALKADLSLLVAANARGTGLVEFTRSAAGSRPQQTTGTQWSSAGFVRAALAHPKGGKSAGFVNHRGRVMLAVAGAICSEVQTCTPTGVAIVGFDAKSLVTEAAHKLSSGTPRRPAGVAIYDTNGGILASGGLTAAPTGAGATSSTQLVRATHRAGKEELATAFAPLELQGRREGTIATTIPTAPSFAATRGAGWRLALVLLAGLIGIVAIGALVNRLILGQVRPLVATNRALGAGDLSARAPVLSHDELGELAQGVNQMAEQLEASVETLELKVQERTEEVRRLLRQRTEFFAALSHEFRTPLAVMLRQADMLLATRAPRPTRWSVETGKVIKQSGHQLLTAINDILDLAKAEAGGLELELEEVRLGDVIREARLTMDGLAKAGRLKIAVNVPRDLPAVRADRTRLREIVLNLVDNAVKYTPEGGSVEISAAPRNGHVAVSVSDTGIGIPPAAKDRVFEPFYRVEGTKTQRGQAATGLGLALTKRLVEAQGGRITLKSKKGSGTTFTFTVRAA